MYVNACPGYRPPHSQPATHPHGKSLVLRPNGVHTSPSELPRCRNGIPLRCCLNLCSLLGVGHNSKKRGRDPSYRLEFLRVHAFSSPNRRRFFLGFCKTIRLVQPKIRRLDEALWRHVLFFRGDARRRWVWPISPVRPKQKPRSL